MYCRPPGLSSLPTTQAREYVARTAGNHRLVQTQTLLLGALETEPPVSTVQGTAQGAPEAPKPARVIDVRGHDDPLVDLLQILPAAHDGPAALGLTDALRDVYLLTSRDGTILSANRTAVEYWSGGIRGAHIADLLLDEEHQVVEGLLATPTGEFVRRSLLLADASEVDGALRWQPSPSGAVIGQWLLRPARGAGFFDDPRLPVATYTCQVAGTWECLSVSPRLRELAGVTPSAWTDDPNLWLESVEPLDRERLIVARLQAVYSGSPMSIRYRLRSAVGTTVWVRDEAIVDPWGLARGIISDAAIDYKREEVFVKLHEAAAQRVQHLRSVLESRDLLFQAFAHDIRNMALGMRSLLRSGQSHVNGSDVDASDPQEVLSAIIDLTREVVELHARHEATSLSPVRLGDLVRRALEHGDTADHPIAVEVDDIIALLDPTIVERILVNLVGNAVRHTPSGTRIRLWARRTQDAVVIAVEDDGPGLPPDGLAIDGFAASPRRPGSDEGLGLGLSFARRLARLHGGDLVGENLAGGGACFIIRLPQPS